MLYEEDKEPLWITILKNVGLFIIILMIIAVYLF